MSARTAAARPAVRAARRPGGSLVMAKIGYARVSTRGQNDDSQVDDLTAYGCDKIFTDTASGKHAARPELDNALAYLREGDVFVITRLSRAMRSLKHLLALADELRERGVGLVDGKAGSADYELINFPFHRRKAVFF
jgi:DNA invertase Pin-like site-specific DNA recombinase